ncbi:MAG: peptidoglycan DD-metalloendopeptidase family protein [Chloroflexi bacterium]|nr:peptidoglycan DD-metalloendopeptidase family protein [Chloroflexota bacterium]
MNPAGKNTQSSRLFGLISWAATGLIVISLLGFTFWSIQPPEIPAPPEATPTAQGLTAEGLSALPSSIPSVSTGRPSAIRGITRLASLKTNIPEQPRYQPEEYKVRRGDSVFGIADDYRIKPETLYWANYEIFDGSPDSIQPGQILYIPPVDGVYYKWKEGDTLDSVAERFDVEPEAILDWPGNNIDLTNPQIAPATYVMIPGGENNDQPLFIQTVTRNSGPIAAACGGGYISRGFFTWPTPNHYLSGYDYGTDGHGAIDISAPEGTPIYAADSGVVTMASVSAWNYGYGNVIQIDHGNGFVTLYAHLSVVSVTQCQSVLGGATIGASGNTGNSAGAHLHFEIRYFGKRVNPWFYLP